MTSTKIRLPEEVIAEMFKKGEISFEGAEKQLKNIIKNLKEKRR